MEDGRWVRSGSAAFSVSLDGFGAGPEQSLEDPLGKRGQELHEWFFHDALLQHDDRARTAAADGVDNDFGAPRDGRLRRLHPGPQHVWPQPRRLGRTRLEGLVGRQSALSRADLHPDPPSARADRDGGRHDLHLRHRRDRERAGAGRGPRRATSTSRSAAASRPCGNICAPG